MTINTTTQARFPSKRNRLRWQAANHGCHCFLLAASSVEAVATMIGCLPTQAIAFGWNRASRRRESRE